MIWAFKFIIVIFKVIYKVCKNNSMFRLVCSGNYLAVGKKKSSRSVCITACKALNALPNYYSTPYYSLFAGNPSADQSPKVWKVETRQCTLLCQLSCVKVNIYPFKSEKEQIL